MVFWFMVWGGFLCVRDGLYGDNPTNLLLETRGNWGLQPYRITCQNV